MKILQHHMAHLLLLDFCKGYSERKLQKVLSLFTQNAHVWGTGTDEDYIGVKEIERYLKRDWSQSESSCIEVVSWVPSYFEDFTWAAAVCKATIIIEGTSYVLDNLRGTVVLEEEDGVLKISHMHASFPDSRQPEGSSFPLAVN